MAKININCPKCNALFKVDEAHIGKKSRCTKCGERFVISRPQESNKTASSDAQSQVEATKPVQPKVPQPIEATIKQDAPQSPAETIPTPKAKQAGGEIAATIAAPAVKDAGEIQQEEQDVPAEWEEGQTILDLYEVKQVYRTGSMGLVYRVHHKNWNMDLAVKSPRVDFFKTEAQKENFIKECETWINLGLHPNIVSCYYVRTLGGIPRVFAEYVEGGSLKDWIDNKKLYESGKGKTLERILDITIQFAWGLQYSHEKDLIHQDVKPANVMMTEDGIAKVTDFGLAEARAAIGESPSGDSLKNILVSSGGMTPAYCSPEQANKEKLSNKTDIWSWGLSVLEMFAGEIFWRAGQAAPEALESFLETGAEDDTIPKISDGLIELLRQCFQQNPDDRPKDMQEITGKLKEIYQDAVDQEYSRGEPKAAELLADGLNNRAVSMLDLGKKEEAENVFNEALKADPHHLEATYNRGLLLWRSGRMRDDELVRQLEEVRTTHQDDWQDEYLLGLVHVERGDARSAVEMLGEAAEQAPCEENVRSAFQTAKTALGEWGQRIHSFDGHTGAVLCVAIGPDSRWIFSGSCDNTLRLWDVATGKCLQIFEGHTDSVNTIKVQTDGRLVFSGSKDGTIRVWDLASKKCLHIFEQPGDSSEDRTPFSISHDGRFAVSGTVHGFLQLWELETGEPLRRTPGEHWGPVYAVALSHDDRFAISGGSDKTLRLWDLVKGQCLRTFEGHTGVVTSVMFLPGGQIALSGSGDGSLRFWNLTTGECIKTLIQQWPIQTATISPKARFAMLGVRRGSLDVACLRLWDLTRNRCLRTFEGHKATVYSVKVSSKRCFAVSVGGDNTVRLWWFSHFKEQAVELCHPSSTVDLGLRARSVLDLKTKAESAMGKLDYKAAYGHVVQAMSLNGYNRDGCLLDLRRRVGAQGRVSSLCQVWRVRTFEGHTGYVNSVKFSPNNHFVLSGSQDKTVRLWDLKSGQCCQTFEGHTKGVKSVTILPEGTSAMSGSPDTTLRQWDLQSGKCVHVLRASAWSLTITPDSRFVLTTGGDKVFRLWDIRNSQLRMTFEGHKVNVICVALSPDGRFALSGGQDKTVRLWRLSPPSPGNAWGICLQTFEGHTAHVGSVGFLPDERFALSGSYDGTFRLWDLRSGACLETFKNARFGPTEFAISRDGQFVFSADDNETARIWKLATGECVRILKGGSGNVGPVAFSRDGHFIVFGAGHDLHLWELVWNYEFPQPADWCNDAKPYLQIFLTLHCSYGPDGISRVDKPVWNDEDFKKLLKELQYRGYGWLRPEGVRKKLEEMTANWQSPPPLPGQ